MEIKSFIRKHQKKISILLMASTFIMMGAVIFAYNIWPNYDGYLLDGVFPDSNPLHFVLELLILVVLGAPYLTGIILYPKRKKTPSEKH